MNDPLKNIIIPFELQIMTPVFAEADHSKYEKDRNELSESQKEYLSINKEALLPIFNMLQVFRDPTRPNLTD